MHVNVIGGGVTRCLAFIIFSSIVQEEVFESCKRHFMWANGRNVEKWLVALLLIAFFL